MTYDPKDAAHQACVDLIVPFDDCEDDLAKYLSAAYAAGRAEEREFCAGFAEMVAEEVARDAPDAPPPPVRRLIVYALRRHAAAVRTDIPRDALGRPELQGDRSVQ